MERDHKATEHRPSDPFDKLLSSMIGLPNGAHTQPTVIQHLDFYGNVTSYMIQTARTDEAIGGESRDRQGERRGRSRSRRIASPARDTTATPASSRR